jgi:uncharacterized protein involved in outer membrane biogenesis
MRNALRLGCILLAALPALAGDVRTINATCEKAIIKAEVLAAQRKWWPDRPDPKAPVLNIRTHANFAKNVLLPLGSVWSHEKVGELAFEERDQSCQVTSNGHPGDVVLSDLAKAEFPATTGQSTEAAGSTRPLTPKAKDSADKSTAKCPQGRYWGDNASGEPVCVWSTERLATH